ncbi:MAG: hypothetical protein R3C59_26580 [Planctomycetaceae bacterium]
MTVRTVFSRRHFAVTIVASLLQGCQSLSNNRPTHCDTCGECDACHAAAARRRRPKGVVLSSPYEPEVVVIGYDCPPTLTFELQHLAEEIRRGLAASGGLRLRECPPMPPAPDDCNTYRHVRTQQCSVPPGTIRPAGYQESQPGTLILPPLNAAPVELHPRPVPSAKGEPLLQPHPVPPATMEPSLPNPVYSASGPAPATEIRVVIHAFRPYRPMQLDVTITVVDVQSGQEITAIQGLWNDKEAAEPIADASHALHRMLKHPPPRSDMEARALSSLSPRLFISGVAREVVPSLHAACLSMTGPSTAAGW